MTDKPYHPFIAQAEDLIRRQDEADALRRNFAKHLAPAYLKDSFSIAGLCDDTLDRRGTLLGYVREEAAKLLGMKDPTS
jgi:hypothetical protein